MRIATAVLHRVQIPLKRSFTHALSARSGTDAVLVQLRDEEGHSGWGEIVPRPYVTGETVPGVLERDGPAMAAAVVGRVVPDQAAAVTLLGELLAGCGRSLATMTGFELAVLDLAGKRLGFSAASCLGEHRGAPLPAGVIVGFETKTEKLARYCAVLRLSGKRHVKVKVGLPDDVERCKLVTEVFGPKVPLRIDANAAWSVDEAVARIEAIAAVCPLHSVEQPVAAADIAGLAAIRRRCGVAVMADESVCSLQDAEALIAAGAADIFNLRLGKHGGLLASKRLCERALQAGVSIHLGTLVGETGILSRAAELFGQCQAGLQCLDGKGQNRWLLEHDILEQPHGAEEAAVDAPGLGIEIDVQRVAGCRVGAPVVIGEALA